MDDIQKAVEVDWEKIAPFIARLIQNEKKPDTEAENLKAMILENFMPLRLCHRHYAGAGKSNVR